MIFTHFPVKDVQVSIFIKLPMWPKDSLEGPRRTAKGSPRAPQGEPKVAKGSQRDKTEFITKLFHEKYTMVTQPKGNKSSVHQFEKWEIHPEDLLVTFYQQNQLFA